MQIIHAAKFCFESTLCSLPLEIGRKRLVGLLSLKNEDNLILPHTQVSLLNAQRKQNEGSICLVPSIKVIRSLLTSYSTR